MQGAGVDIGVNIQSTVGIYRRPSSPMSGLLPGVSGLHSDLPEISIIESFPFSVFRAIVYTLDQSAQLGNRFAQFVLRKYVYVSSYVGDAKGNINPGGMAGGCLRLRKS